MIVTIVHVVAGSVVMLVAPAALFVRKGGRWHRRWGHAFAIAMAVVLLSASFMWESKGHLFLFVLSLVSAYLIFSGYRIVRRRRRRERDGRDDAFDLATAGLACASGLWLVAIALGARNELMRSLAPIVGALGVVAISFAANDVRGLVRKPSRIGWLLAHFSAMIAAYISAVTAFVVINVHAVPMSLRWIVPSALGSLLIASYSIRYRRLSLSKIIAQFASIRQPAKPPSMTRSRHE